MLDPHGTGLYNVHLSIMLVRASGSKKDKPLCNCSAHNKVKAVTEVSIISCFDTKEQLITKQNPIFSLFVNYNLHLIDGWLRMGLPPP